MGRSLVPLDERWSRGTNRDPRVPTFVSTCVARATIHRILSRHGAVVPEPAKRPRSSYIRFEAAQPNDCWQSDFTRYRLTRPGSRPVANVEIITWPDDHSRYAVNASAHPRISARIVADTFTLAAAQHGYPAATQTDNGMVHTVRLAPRRGGRTALETERDCPGFGCS